MPMTILSDDQQKPECDAEREVREITEQINRINALIANQIRFETRRAK